jgi:ABC-type dipeptide/oligopeptide/nickel transport system permease component
MTASAPDAKPVLQKIGERLPITLSINVIALGLTVLLSLPIGVVAATRRNTLFDRLTTLYVFIGFSAPSFWVALLAVTDGAVGATWPEVFAAFAVGYLLTGMPFTPGGLGAFDVVVVGGLTLAGENPDVATAAVALYRIATYAVYAPAAAAAWPTWRRLRAKRPLPPAAGPGAAPTRRVTPRGRRVAEAEGFEPSRGD